MGCSPMFRFVKWGHSPFDTQGDVLTAGKASAIKSSRALALSASAAVSSNSPSAKHGLKHHKQQKE